MPVYDEITQAIIAELEKGVPPWVESRSSHLADECCLPKRVSGHQYPSSLRSGATTGQDRGTFVVTAFKRLAPPPTSRGFPMDPASSAET